MLDSLDELLGLKGDTNAKEEGEDRVRERKPRGDKPVERDDDDGDDEASPELVDSKPEPDEESEEGGDEREEDSTSKEDVDLEAKPEDEDGEEDEEGAKPDEDKSKEGLIREIQKLRNQVASFRPKQPTPPPPGQTTEVQPGVQIGPRIEVSPDGKSVYVDPKEMQEHVARAVREEQERLNTPTPSQIRMARVQQMTQEFVAEDPTRQGAVERVFAADEYLTLHVQNLIQQGAQITNIYDAVRELKQAGVDKQALALFPELGAVGFDDFVEGMGHGEASTRRLIYKQVQSALTPTKKPKTPKAPRPLGKTPRSMARKGGSRQVVTSDEAEFNALEREFQADIVGMPKAKHQRMVQLAKKLGIEGVA